RPYLTNRSRRDSQRRCASGGQESAGGKGNLAGRRRHRAPREVVVIIPPNRRENSLIDRGGDSDRPPKRDGQPRNCLARQVILNRRRVDQFLEQIAIRSTDRSIAATHCAEVVERNPPTL